MRPHPLACLLGTLVLGASSILAAAVPTRLTGVGGEHPWSLTLAGDSPAQGPLLAKRWAPHLPDLTVRLLGGGTFRTADQRGKVVLLDVWASWCAPCKVELPHLQALADAERERGLVAVAINAQEPEELVARAAAAFGIGVPVGLYDASLDGALQVRSLPAVLLLDRQGDLRARWDGYQVGLEHEIAARVRALLAETPETATERVGEILAGAGAMRPRLWRELPAAMTGLAAVPGAPGGARLIFQGGRRLFALDPDGTMTSGPEIPAPSGRLLAADLNRDERPDIVSWGRARREAVMVDLAGGTPRTFEAAAPILDLAVLPGGWLVFATADALAIADRLGAVHAIAGTGAATGLVVRGGELWAIDAATRRPRRFAREGDTLVERAAALPEGWPADAWQAVSAEPALVLASAGSDLTPGSFTGRGRREVAVRSGRGEVTVLDAATGEVRFAARLDAEVVQLAAADLDGDGIDELAVLAGRGVLVLEGKGR